MSTTPQFVTYKGHVITLDTALLQSVAPHAPRMTYRGRSLVVMPHGVDLTRLLRNMGYDLHAPILEHYDWRGDVPYDSQRITAGLITMNQRPFVLNEMGTGKTRAMLYAFDWLHKTGECRRMLVAAPLSILRQSWEREVFSLMPDLRVEVLYGSRAKRVEALDRDADIYVINHDGVSVIVEELRKRVTPGDIDMICIDELSVYKNVSTTLWKTMHKLTNACERIVGMTGTPMANTPEDAHGQVLLLRPNAVTRSKKLFRDMVMKQVTTYKWIPRPDAVATVYGLMKPSVRFTRDDCYDLPPVQYITHKVPLSTVQDAAYTEMWNTCVAEMSGASVKAVNEADLRNKLLQVALGCVYDADHQSKRLGCAPRLALLDELLTQAPSKVIVFAPFHHVVDMLTEHLAPLDPMVVTGSVSVAARDTIFGRFRNDPDARVLIAHPKCMSHGLTLTEASTIIWFGPPSSLETYEQANARITRKGQQRSQLVVHLSATRLEDAIYKRLEGKAHLQGTLFNLVEDTTRSMS